MTTKMEKRELITRPMEIREDEDGKRTLTGYAVMWEKKSHVLGYFNKFREQFRRGAFSETLLNDDQYYLYSHNKDSLLGSTENGSLTLEEDEIGLRFEVELLNTTLARDVYEMVRSGLLRGVSFGFQMVSDEYEEFEDDFPLRTVTKAKLFEVSAVAFPAYPDSTVSARGFDPYKAHAKEVEERNRRVQLIKTLTLL